MPSTGWLLYVLWPEIKPTTVVYWEAALTNWTIQTGLIQAFNNQIIFIRILLESYQKII